MRFAKSLSISQKEGPGWLLKSPQPVNVGDVALIQPKEKYYFKGDFEMVVPCSPAWYPSQHKIIVESKKNRKKFKNPYGIFKGSKITEKDIDEVTSSLDRTVDELVKSLK